MVALEPSGLVRGYGEGVGVGLREHVVAVDLGEYLSGDLFRNTVAPGAFQESPPVHGDQSLVVGSCEGAAHLVGFRRRHARHVLDELDDLLLPYDDPVAPLKGASFQRMVVIPLRAVSVPFHELGDGATLYADTGTDEGDLISEVEEVARSQALRHLQLGR